MWSDSPQGKAAQLLLDTFRTVQRRPLDEKDFLRAVLDFANTGSLIALGRQVSGAGPALNGPTENASYIAAADADSAERYCGEREQLQKDLARVTAGTADARFVARIREGARVIKVPQVTGGDHYVAELPEALSHAVTLLLDQRLPFQKDLHRCLWQECGHFFFSSDASKRKPNGPGGLPRTKYHSDDCMKKARDKNRPPRKPHISKPARHK